MTSYSPPLTRGRLSRWHSRCRDSIKAMGGTTSNEAGGADGTPLLHMDPPNKIGEDQFVVSHGIFSELFGAKTTGSCILYVLFVYIFWPFIVYLEVDWALMLQHNKGYFTWTWAPQILPTTPLSFAKNNLYRCSSRLVFYDESIQNVVTGDAMAMLNIYIFNRYISRDRFDRAKFQRGWLGSQGFCGWRSLMPWYTLIWYVWGFPSEGTWENYKKIQPGNWTWPLKIGLPKRKVVFQPPFFWAMLNKFWGCTGGSSSCTECCCCWPAGNYQHVSCVVDVDLTT